MRKNSCTFEGFKRKTIDIARGVLKVDPKEPRLETESASRSPAIALPTM